MTDVRPAYPRNIRTGLPIPCEDYCDQPYIVRADDGAWLCVMTTARGEEGARNQHIVATRSTNHGRTWSPLIAVEPPGPPESSYATLVKTPAGRIYVFYNHNTDNVRTILAETEYSRSRVDTLGHFVFKYSDDGGVTWSAERYEIPIRLTRIDRENPYGGTIRFFWHVGKPLIHNGAVYVPLHKVGSFGVGFMTRSEGWFLCSPNLLTERDPSRITWETLPDGETGLKAPVGPIADENRAVALSDGSLFSTYRTVDGHPGQAYSRDNGHTWTAPAYLAYANQRLVKHPRAANFVWRCDNGQYLYWFHNHGGKWYEGRNPVWICGGVEADSPDGKRIRWSQPEILLYDDEPTTRISYPDLIEDNGRYWITETQKTIARVHEIDAALLDGLWAQFADVPAPIKRNGLLLEIDGETTEDVPAPQLPDLRKGGGFSVELWTKPSERKPLDVRVGTRAGWMVEATKHATFRLTLQDGQAENVWESDPLSDNDADAVHVVVTVDAGPKIITFVVNGVLSDGGSERQYGWGRFSPYLSDVSGSGPLQIGGTSQLRLYDRPLTTSEAVAHFRAGCAAR